MGFLNYLVILTLIFLREAFCLQRYTIEETLVADDAFAGDSFNFQPMVSIYEESTGAIATGFQGDVYAILISGPTGYEKLIYNGTVGSTKDNAVEFYGGIAKFKGLSLNEAGHGYRLRYIARKYSSSGDTEVAQVDGKPFSVSLNSPHHLKLLVHPGSGTAGQLLRPQPIVSVVDRGGNVIESVNNEGYVTVQLAMKQNTTGLHATLRGTLEVTVIDGKAIFTNLHINEASIEPYYLKFQFTAYTDDYDALRLNSDVVESTQFGVGIGPPHALHILSSPDQGAILGGSAFEYPPLLELVDAGGNRIVKNSHDYVSASFARNPWSASLAPSNNTMQRLDRGVARFSQLAINNAGDLYSLRFKLVTLNKTSAEFEAWKPSVYVDTPHFNVKVGPPYRLRLQRQPSGAIAGGSALTVQPIVAITDVGGNVVRSDSESMVVAHLVASPSSAQLVRVDTSSADRVKVKQVYINELSASYGDIVTIGDNLIINIEFDQEVTVGATSALPRLELGIVNASSRNSHNFYATATRKMVGLRTKTLEFLWSVPETIRTNRKFALSYASINALTLPSGCSLLDNLGRSANITLPPPQDEAGLLKMSNITVDTFIPQVVSMGVYVETTGMDNVPIVLNASTFASHFNDYESVASAVHVFNNAMYAFTSSSSPPDTWSFSLANQQYIEVGAGHLILIEVDFDQKVVVQGKPYLLLNITVDNNQTSGTTSVAGTVNQTNQTIHVPHKLSKVVSATYVCGSKNKLLFGYEVTEGDKVEAGTFKLLSKDGGSIHTNDLNTLSYPALSPTPAPTKSSQAIESAIYRDADIPKLNANLTLPATYKLETLASKLVIDTEAPVVNITKGDVRCLSSDGIYRVGDELRFEVRFNKKVVASDNVKLALDTGKSSAVYAKLESGYGTSLRFVYVVSSGDSISRLNSWYSSNNLHSALVLSHGSILRLSTSSQTSANIAMNTPVSKWLNETSAISVDGIIPTIQDAFIESVLASSASTIYDKSNVDTNIQLKALETSNISIGVDSQVRVNITWSHPVTLVRGHHKLYLSAGKTKEAIYVAGNNTRFVQYLYTVDIGDMLVRSSTSKCSKCYTGSCRTPEACPWSLSLRYTPNALNGDIRQLSSSPSLFVEKSFLSLKHRDERSGRSFGIPLYAYNDSSKNVFVDTSEESGGSRETYLVGFTTLKSDGVYGAGENIQLIVEFSDDVSISDAANPPRVRLNLENRDPYATYISGSGGRKLKFLYRIKQGDNSSALDWSLTSGSSFFSCNVSSVVNDTTISTSSTTSCGLLNNNNMAVNVTLAASKLSTGVEFPSLTASSLIEVNTEVPMITRVFTDKNESTLSSGSYTVGEAFNIMVEYDQPVALFAKPLLYIASRGEDSAVPLTCLGYTPSNRYQPGDEDDDLLHSDSRSSAGKYGYSLLFRYVVQPGDHSGNLSLATRAAVSRVTYGREDNALTLNYNQATIKRDSNYPMTEANLSVAHLFDRNGMVRLALDDRILKIDTSHIPQITNVTWASEESSYVSYFSRIGRRNLLSNVKGSKFQTNLASTDVGDGVFRPGDKLVFKVSFDVPVTFGPSFTSEGVTKQVVDGGDGEYVSTENAIDYFQEIPFLWLETGEVDRKAYYFKGDKSADLYFSYEVMSGDVSFDLEYVDVHSLNPGVNASLLPAHLYQVSSHPSMIANLTLPLVGRSGSLSFNQNIKIEGNTPYISLITYVFEDFDRASATDDVTFQDDTQTDDTVLSYASRAGVVATLTTSESVYIKVVFSEPVVIEGNPRIRMGLDDDDGRYVINEEGEVSAIGDEDGDFVSDASDQDYRTGSYGSAYSSGDNTDRGGRGVVVRYADYFNGTNTSEVLFKYTVSTGDMCVRMLDYHADERQFRSSAQSFDLSQGSIYSASFHPCLAADVHLNPAGGYLQAASSSIGSVAALSEGAEERDERAHLYGTDVTVSNGVATFEDLSIVQRGPNYRLNFESLPYDSPYVLKTESMNDIEVEYSCEYEVSGRDRESGDAFGHSVDVAGDLMIAGAPYKHLDVHEVQYVRTSGDVARDIKEIQIIGISTDVQSEVQSFFTSTAAQGTVKGSFRLSYDDGKGNSGETIDILHNAPGESVAVALQEALPGMGVFHVEREDYTWCACKEAFKWKVTFVTATSNIQLLSTDGSDLIGNSKISTVTSEQQSPWLNGTFYLGLEGFGGDWHYVNPNGHMYSNNNPNMGPIGAKYSFAFPEQAIKTRALAIDASPSELIYAIETDLGLKVDDISVEKEDDRNGRHYIITFSHQYTEKTYFSEEAQYLNRTDYGLDNNVLQLKAFKDGVGGSGPDGTDIWVKTLREGGNRLWGTFTLSFREPVGADYLLSKRYGDLPSTTNPIPYNASAAQVAFELERLGSIGGVTVTKDFEVGLDHGALWAITFNSVRRLTNYGWSPDTMDNLEPLVSNDIGLHGTNRRVEVGHRSGGVDDYPYWAPKRLGSFGEHSGVAYVFQRSGITQDQYSEVARLSAHDADQHDLFGWSVALSGGGRPWGKEQGTGVTTGFGGIDSGKRPMVAVGAPSKDDGGVLEQQWLRCLADAGYFKLFFRGSESDWIPFNISHREFVVSIRSSFGPCLSCHSGATADPMHVFPAIEVEPFEGGLCSTGSENDKWYPASWNTSTGALITFLTPSSYDASGDLELLEVDSSRLDYEGVDGAGNATVIEMRQGTSVSAGPDAKGAQKGAVYMFGSGDDNGFGQASLWRQHAKLVLPDGGEADRFGWCVSMSTDGNTLVVSAPGEGGEIGAIYIFERSDEVFKEPLKNANYGSGEWVRTQRLDASVFSSASLDKFGESMALSPDGNTIVVGAPGFNRNKGAAYILLRNSYSGKFRMHQQLKLGTRTAVEGDLFGCAVALDHHTVAVSACGRSDYTIHTGTIPAAEKQHASGAVYIYLREYFEDYYFFTQKLIPSNVVAEDRFGYSIAVSNDTLIASSLSVPPDRSQLNPRHAVYQVTTSALSQAFYPKAQHVGSTFTLSWRSQQNAGSTWLRKESRPIETDASASELATILEEDLGTGFVRVARTPVDADTGGFTWYVTFANSDGDFSGGGVPVLEADGTMLTGSSPSVRVTELNPVPAKVRGVVRAFIRPTGSWADTLDGHWKPFVEQAMLYPEVKQRQDLFGFDVALDGEVAVVGAPNRDSFVSFANGGSAFAYDLDFLRLEINEEDPYEVFEGHGQVIPVVRYTHIDTVQILKLESLDRNMNMPRQERARDLFGLDDASLFKGGGGSGGAHGGASGLFATVADYIGAGSAYARSQYYGSSENKSIWVDGAFDYRGVSDYLPLSQQMVMYGGQTRNEIILNTTNDNIVEQPDENVTVAVRIPGMWASLLGSLSVELVIIDDADGSGAANGYSCYEKLFAEDGELEDGFGGSVAVSGDIAVVGAPNAPGTKHESGAAYVFRRVAGYWEQETRLEIPHNNVTRNVDDDSDDGGGGYTRGMGGVGESGRGQYDGTRARFGTSVAVAHAYLPIHSRQLRPRTTVLVGSPGTAEVHVFSRNGTQMRHWRYEGKLTHPEAVYPHHRYGEKGAIAIHQDVAVIGAAGLEAIFVFRRKFEPTKGMWTWRRGLKLLSSDYDYDLILDKIYMHRMNFGIAVSMSARTIAVGAPLADYGNLGDTSVRETFNTNGVDNYGVGRGKVYIFHSAPHQQTISLRSDTQLYAGTWRVQLYHRNITATSEECKYDATSAEVKHALEKMVNIDEVEVSYRLLEGGLKHRWQISFLSENEDPPLMIPLWQSTTSTAAGFEGTARKAGGCGESVGGCVNMSTVYTGSEQSSMMVVELTEKVGDWLEIQDIQANDKSSGDRFGASLSMHKEVLVVGAPHSAALTTTTWDFETGDLIGWTVEGNAFDYQPTYGDNMLARSVYGEEGDRRSHGGAKRGNIQGRYFIGTYERRPGAGRGSYQQPHPDFPAGNVQGDKPIGTITSEPFSIPDTLEYGSGVHFNIGGGCDPTHVYVELLVDGVGVDRVTGRCEETMKSKMFDLSLYAGRTAQVRVVDMSSGPWGHINVDSFEFDWGMGGGEVSGRTSAESSFRNNETAIDVNGNILSKGQKVHRGMPESTPESGAAYVFRRQQGGEDVEVCGADERLCLWKQDTRLVASDKRKSDRFGSSVDIDDDTGTVVVGAVGASASSNLFGPRIQPANHPYRADEVTGVKLPLSSSVVSRIMVAPQSYTPLATGLSGYLATKQYNARSNVLTRNVINTDFDELEFEKSGAVYVFTRRSTVFSGGTGVKKVGRTVEPSVWPTTEQFRVSVPSLAARDRYGDSVAIDGDTVFVGIPGDDGNGRNVGAAAMFDVAIQRCYFMSAEYVVVEGERPHVVVTIGRDSEWLGRPLTISFATSDLTAKGIDRFKYEECMNLELDSRTNCGDYMQTAGEITFGAKDSEVAFAVFIVNDLCHEMYSEYILLTLSIPGAQALGGEDYTARIRIDDDDAYRLACTP